MIVFLAVAALLVAAIALFMNRPEFGPIHKKGDRRDQQGRNCKENDHTANYFTFHIEQQTCIAEVS